MMFLCALALAAAVSAHAPEPSLAAGYRTRGLVGGWGHGWPFAVPGWGKTRSNISFLAFHPRLGWLVTDRFEIYGEGTLLLYHRPAAAVSAGVGGLAGRLYWATDRPWVPYATLGAGLLWTSLKVPEIDRIFNFQIFYGAGVRQVTRKGPGLVIELRNHHISNAGTRGENLGVNALTLLAGVEWTLR
jgi:lipid A 3-O-deacylase